MMLTTEQRKELVDFNIQQARAILFEAKKADKDMYVHEINAKIEVIENCLETDKTMTMDCPDFHLMCKTKEQLAATLFMNEKKI